jgi:DNA-directed RNA polymerase specialized sigma subunit
MYENHQKQRYFERNIRKYKRLAKTHKQALAANTDKAVAKELNIRHKHYKNLAGKWNKAYQKFSLDKKLRTQPDRTQI